MTNSESASIWELEKLLKKMFFRKKLMLFVSILLRNRFWFRICHFLWVYLSILWDIGREILAKIIKMPFFGQNSLWLQYFWAQYIGSDQGYSYVRVCAGRYLFISVGASVAGTYPHQFQAGDFYSGLVPGRWYYVYIVSDGFAERSQELLYI